MTLYYGEDPAADDTYPVELYDRVEVTIRGNVYDGEIVQLHPRLRQVTVKFIDHNDIQRSTGEPRRRPARIRVPVSAVELIARSA